MHGPLQSIQSLKADISQFLRVAHERHSQGNDSFGVVQGLSDSVDGALRQLFLQVLEGHQDQVALVAVGGYGRRELCPHSDIDILFLRNGERSTEQIGRLVRLLTDGGFELGHAVRTPAECLFVMSQDPVTAAAHLESRFLAGSNALYERFIAVAVNRYKKRWGEVFARNKLDKLWHSLNGPDRTIYVLEPNLKDGCCGLRDIQRVLWVEQIRRGQATFDALARGGAFDPEEIETLRAAYGFYLRVRCELHFTNKIKQDVIERDTLVGIAANIGYAGAPAEAVEALMADYYRHARAASRFLRHYLETGTRGRRFFSKLSHKFLGKSHKPYLVEENGYFFPNGALPEVRFAEEVMDVFLIAQREGLALSESLSREIRQRLADPALDFAHSPVASACFVEILRLGPVGRILKAMHWAGVLTRLVPEFAALDGKVNFDGHHQFTVDEHILRALEELDRVEAGADSVPREVRDECRKIRDIFPLRLALILHDIGKGMPGEDHSVSGTGAAIIACERLSLDEATIETVEFLIYRHIEMFRASERPDLGEARLIDSFARLVGNEERLAMLYVLTYVDITSVGPGTWTAWKGAQLAEVYQRTLASLRAGASGAMSLEELLRQSKLSESERRAVLEHCLKVSSSVYNRETVPERMLVHVRLAQELLTSGETQIHHEDLGEYHDITFCCLDRPHLFADLAGVLFSEGFNVLGARIFSRSDGIAIDTFYVEVVDGVRIQLGPRVEHVRAKLQRIEKREVEVEHLIRDWMGSFRYRNARRTGLALCTPAVTVDNDSSPSCTVLDVLARDRPGLLYELADAISRLGLDVRSAKVSTLTDRARDVFQVVVSGGGKVAGAGRKEEIEELLLAVARGQTRSSSGRKVERPE